MTKRLTSIAIVLGCALAFWLGAQPPASHNFTPPISQTK